MVGVAAPDVPEGEPAAGGPTRRLGGRIGHEVPAALVIIFRGRSAT
jgi:hypothetical protein